MVFNRSMEFLYTTAIICSFFIVVVWADIPCLSDDECSDNQMICGPQNHCIKEIEFCQNDNQCLDKDHHLKCTKSPGKTHAKCDCEKGYEFVEHKCQPIIKTHKATRDYDKPDHIKTNPMQPGAKIQHSIALDKTKSDNNKKKNFIKSKYFGPVAIICIGLVIFGLCLCFWSIKIPSLRQDLYSIDGTRNKTDMEMGVENPAYQADNLSYFTTQTEICEANHSEYLNQHRENETNSKNVQQNVNGNAPNGKKRVIYTHDVDISLTTSMDDADAEVATIYKVFTTAPPVLGRLDSVTTPPPVVNKFPNNNQEKTKEENIKEEEHKESKEPNIMRLDTPDCTSIDTTIPLEEMKEFEEGIERKKEIARFVNEGLESADESNNDQTNTGNPVKEYEEKKENDSESISIQQCSDYVDEVFKPVFSIS